MIPCERCGEPQDDRWPGSEGELCQGCYERECDAMWWDWHQAIARVITPETFPDAGEADRARAGRGGEA